MTNQKLHRPHTTDVRSGKVMYHYTEQKMDGTLVVFWGGTWETPHPPTPLWFWDVSQPQRYGE